MATTCSKCSLPLRCNQSVLTILVKKQQAKCKSIGSNYKYKTISIVKIFWCPVRILSNIYVYNIPTQATNHIYDS